MLVANKIDVDYNVTRKEFKFASKHNLPFFFVSAADGTNVVKVFQSAILEAKRFKESGGKGACNNNNGIVVDFCCTDIIPLVSLTHRRLLVKFARYSRREAQDQ